MMGNLLMGRRMVIGICLINLLTLPASAAEGDITSLWGIIGDPVAAFNDLDASTKSTIQWALAILLVATLICVVFGISKNSMKAAVGSSSKDAKMTTSGITDNIMIGATILVGIIILGVAIGLIMGIGK